MIIYWGLFFFALMWHFLCVPSNGRLTFDLQLFRGVWCWFLVFSLSLFAGIFSGAGSFDYQNYVDFFDQILPISDWNFSSFFELKDPFFQFLGYFFKTDDGGLGFFVFFIASLSLSIKIRILKEDYFNGILGLAVLFLFSRFFLLHEFTQIRVALGIAFVSLSVIFSLEGKGWSAVLFLVLAGATHASTVVLAPAVILVYPVNLKIKFLVGILFALIAFVLGFVFKDEIFLRLQPYLEGEYHASENTVFSFYFFFKVFVLYFLLLQWDSLNSGVRCALLVSGYGLGLTLVFLENEVLSLRFGELVSVFDCICFAYFFRYGVKANFFLGEALSIVVVFVFYNSTTNIVYSLAGF